LNSFGYYGSNVNNLILI